MEHAFPIVRGVVRDLVDRARVGDVDADRRRGWSGQRKRIENSQGEIAAPRCLDHKLRVESGPRAVGIDILDAGDRASLIGDEPLDARALSDLDIDVSVQARSREEFDQCARERIRIEPEIPLRERIVAWTLHPNVEADPYRHRPSTGEIAFELRKEFREGALSACQEGVDVLRLRDTVPRGGVRRQPVALDDHDVLEIRRQRARRGETAHAGADDDGSLSDGRHSYLTCFTMTGSHSLSASPGRSACSAVW